MPGPPISHSYKYGQWTITDKAGVRRQVTISPPAASPEEEGATFKKDSQVNEIVATRCQYANISVVAIRCRSFWGAN